MTDSYSGQSSVKTYIWAPCKVPDPENKTSGSHYKAVWKDLHYKFFWEMSSYWVVTIVWLIVYYIMG